NGVHFKEQITNFINGELEDIIAIRVMGGIFPIPNRFFYSFRKNSKYQNFFSGPWKISDDGSFKKPKTQIGSLHIGSMEDCEVCQDGYSGKTLGYETLKEFKNLKMKRFFIKNNPKEGFYVIHDSHTHISIYDDSEETWSASFEVLKRTSTKKN
ncbi:MAG TPA: hypothetical protein DD979_07915, partial [Gammaproteobacteria bacterium]|nr:hypothetical protein [Gammaproteobacteria bacterium]